jgi:hypothetical protein
MWLRFLFFILCFGSSKCSSQVRGVSPSLSIGDSLMMLVFHISFYWVPLGVTDPYAFEVRVLYLVIGVRFFEGCLSHGFLDRGGFCV